MSTTAPTTTPTPSPPLSFTSTLPTPTLHDHKLQLATFVLHHHHHTTPLCLVTSGGTAVDLEVRAVRTLENFSTGHRGAVSVEAFLARGYAVVHLWRTGSASPYARRLCPAMAGSNPHTTTVTVDTVRRLLVRETDATGRGVDNDDDGDDDDDALVQTVLEQEDPWLTRDDDGDPHTAASTPKHGMDGRSSRRRQPQGLRLHRSLARSSVLHKAMEDRANHVDQSGRLLTIPFRTVEEYLAKLELCARALAAAQSLAVFYLAAAVSDFYIPASEKPEHKIQSGGDSGNGSGNGSNGDSSKSTPSSTTVHDDGSMTLHLQPVPKVLKVLREEWAPHAFVVSFKLETNADMLRRKAERAVAKYGCHMVIGNLLQSRHDRVSILAPDTLDDPSPTCARDWPMTDVTRSSGNNNNNNNSGMDGDSLESSIVNVVVQSHFEYISWNCTVDDPSAGSGIEAVQKQMQALRRQKEQLEYAVVWKQMKQGGLQVVGALLAFWISYSINTVLQRRSNRSSSRGYDR